MSAPVSVLVPTLDEEVNLPECLASLAWADEVFVVDSLSHDRTLEIARAHGAIVVQHPFESYSRQKNWALETLPFRNEWVLIVDADERVTPELRCEIERELAEDVARPIIFYERAATCWQPYVKGQTMMVNSIFNGNRREDVWLDK